MSALRNPHRNAIDRVVAAYLAALLVGTGLLMLPAATSTPGGITVLSALFTAASAISVTGLEVLSTSSDFTSFGQAVILMFVGGGPAGTAGGVKITTVLVLLAMTWAEISGGTTPNLLGSRVARSAYRQATTVIVLALALVATATIILMLDDPRPGLDRLLFEVVSGFGNVGSSTGINAGLPETSQVVLIVVMILGRRGPVTVASGLALRARTIQYDLPVERPLIG
jgi:Trk-type K+ transport system membrane component